MGTDLLREIAEARESYQLHLVSTFYQDKNLFWSTYMLLNPDLAPPDTVYLNDESASNPVGNATYLTVTLILLFLTQLQSLFKWNAY